MLEYYKEKAVLIDNFKELHYGEVENICNEAKDDLISDLERLDKKYNIDVISAVKEEYDVIIESVDQYINNRWIEIQDEDESW